MSANPRPATTSSLTDSRYGPRVGSGNSALLTVCSKRGQESCMPAQGQVCTCTWVDLKIHRPGCEVWISRMQLPLAHVTRQTKDQCSVRFQEG
jgi:hypothetical protein